MTAIYPDAALSNRLNFGETEEIGVLITNRADVPGQEELVVLSAPAAQGAPRTVLTALADPVQMRDLREGAPDMPALEQWLFAAADPENRMRNFSFRGALPALEELNLLGIPASAVAIRAVVLYVMALAQRSRYGNAITAPAMIL